MNMKQSNAIMAPFVEKAKEDVKNFTDPKDFYTNMAPATTELYDTMVEAIDDYIRSTGFSSEPDDTTIDILDAGREVICTIKLEDETYQFMQALRAKNTFMDIFKEMTSWYDQILAKHSGQDNVAGSYQEALKYNANLHKRVTPLKEGN